MRRRMVAFILVVCLTLPLAGCGKKQETIVLPNSQGIATGEKQNTMRTPLLDFSVLSVQTHTLYEKQTPTENEQFIDVLVEITNTGSAPLTLVDTDFQLQWGTSGFADPMVSFSDEMAPLEATLETGATVQYHYLFSVSVNITNFKLCYLYGGDEAVKAEIFYVLFNL